MTPTPENSGPTNPEPTELIPDQAAPQPDSAASSAQGNGPVPGQWQPADATATAAPVEPPEGWQAGYAKQHRRAQGFMIATIVLGITTILAGVLALGLGTAMVVRNVADGPGGHSRMDGGRDSDDRGFDDSGEMRGYGNNQNGNGNGQRGNRMQQLPTPTATPTPTAPTTVTPTPTPTS